MTSRILVADDSPNILSFLKPALERQGHTVLLAKDGEEALYLWETEHPDLLILDIEMPEPNGLAVCRKVRDSGDAVPIIFLTVRDSVSDLEFGFSVGASDYVSNLFYSSRREVLGQADLRQFADLLEMQHEAAVNRQHQRNTPGEPSPWLIREDRLLRLLE